jgi:hypothetical protein
MYHNRARYVTHLDDLIRHAECVCLAEKPLFAPIVAATLAQAHNAILKQRGRSFVGSLLEQIDANLGESETQSEVRTGKKLEQASELPGLEKPPELTVDTSVSVEDFRFAVPRSSTPYGMECRIAHRPC